MIVSVDENLRLNALFELDLDYTELENNFKGITKLAAEVAGCEMSVVNLIDAFTQWSISGHGVKSKQTPREESVCQYTILEDSYYEVENFKTDKRFENTVFALDDEYKYYLGIPLKTKNGQNIGALCVLDSQSSHLSKEKIELLEIIAKEIVNQLSALKYVKTLEQKLKYNNEKIKRLAHDLRSPLSGTIGLSELILMDVANGDFEEIQEYIKLIQKSSEALISYADELLDINFYNHNNLISLGDFKEKLIELYSPQAISKRMNYLVSIEKGQEQLQIDKKNILQITGNLIANAIKFTPSNNHISVFVSIVDKQLQITIKDTGKGMDKDKIDKILMGDIENTIGTEGEIGYGFGLNIVKKLINDLNGTLMITSQKNKGSTFRVVIPQNSN